MLLNPNDVEFLLKEKLLSKHCLGVKKGGAELRENADVTKRFFPNCNNPLFRSIDNINPTIYMATENSNKSNTHLLIDVPPKFRQAFIHHT